MTQDQFQALVDEVGNRLNISPIYSHGGEVAQLGDSELELHRSGVFRRCRYLIRDPHAEQIAESIRLES